MTFFIVDLETQNHPHMGDVAPPFHPENYIVAPAFCIDDGPVKHWYFNSREEADKSDWFQIPDTCQYLVAHNATFEIVWFLHRHRDEFMRFLKRGGRVLCTQLAEYLLSNQTEMYPALNDVAPRYGGTEKMDAVKVLWEQGVLTADIDKALLLEYLAGPEGDIENTRLTVFGQIPRLQEQGMWPMYLERCEAMLYAAFCKYFGMFVNVPQATEDGAALAAQIQDILASLKGFLPNDLPDAKQFNWGSDFHVSALMFGGPIKFKVKVPYDPPKYEKVPYYQLTSDWDSNEEPSVPAANQFQQDSDAWHLTVSEFERIGAGTGNVVCYKSGKNKGLPKVFDLDGPVEKLKWGEEVYTFPGLVPFSSLPREVAAQFTDKRGEFRGKRHLCDRQEEWSADGTKLLRVLNEGTPVYSSSKDALDLLIIHAEHPLPRLLKVLGDGMKIHGTYYVGMLNQVDSDGMLRRAINNTSTITGRLSSGLQQMPRGGSIVFPDGTKRPNAGSKVKEMFWSRFPGGNIIECDFTALEVVHLACLSGDKELLKYLQDGTDMHILRLASKLHRPYEELLAIYQNPEHPEFADIVAQRQGVKPLSFQYQYGGTAPGMVFKIKGLTLEAAQEFIDNENQLFPQSSNYRYVTQEEVEERAKTAPVLRETTDEGGWSIYKRSYRVGPSGTRYSYRQYEKWEYVNGKKTKTMQFKISQLANYESQGEASLVMQVATGLIIRWLIAVDFYDWKALPISTVHDAAYLDTAPELTNMVAKHTKVLMEYAPKHMANVMPGYAALGIQHIPYPAVPEVGPNMKAKKHLEDDTEEEITV